MVNSYIHNNLEKSLEYYKPNSLEENYDWQEWDERRKSPAEMKADGCVNGCIGSVNCLGCLWISSIILYGIGHSIYQYLTN